MSLCFLARRGQAQAAHCATAEDAAESVSTSRGQTESILLQWLLVTASRAVAPAGKAASRKRRAGELAP